MIRKRQRNMFRTIFVVNKEQTVSKINRGNGYRNFREVMIDFRAEM